jgi:hypothetical protein
MEGLSPCFLTIFLKETEVIFPSQEKGVGQGQVFRSGKIITRIENFPVTFQSGNP